jgi:hypothetical protein
VLIYNESTDEATYSNSTGSVNGKISGTNSVEDVFFSDFTSSALFEVGDSDIGDNSSGFFYVGVGTSGNDVISFAGDSSSAKDITHGTLSHDIDGGTNLGAALFGAQGNDTLTGSSDDDIFVGGSGSDTINGGSGFDKVTYAGDSAAGGSAGITVNVSAGTIVDGFGATDNISSIELFEGTNSADTFSASGTSSFVRFAGLGGSDTFTGSSTDDELDYSHDSDNGGSAGITINLASGTATDGFGNTDTFSSIEMVRGTNSADTMTGGGNDSFERFRGLGGADTFIGTTGGFQSIDYSHDNFFGGGSAVTVNFSTNTAVDGFGATDTFSNINRARGTEFNDTFIAGSSGFRFRGLDGADTFTGGAGSDRIEYTSDSSFGGTAGVTVNLSTGTAVDGFGKTDTFTSIEQVRGTNQADTLTGGSGSFEMFEGMGGNDTIDGGAGTDRVSYENEHFFGSTSTASVTVNLSTGTATDTFGNTDTLSNIEEATGTANADTLTGDANSNTLIGLGGADTLSGGAGSDSFRVQSNSDVVSGESIDGGTGTDTIKADSTSVTTLDLTVATLTSIEALDLTGGSTSGVTATISSSQLTDFTTITGDGTSDEINLSSVTNSVSGVTFSGIHGINLSLGSGTKQTLTVDSTTVFGGAEIEGFTQGSAGTADVFDWETAVKTGAGVSISAGTDLSVTSLTGQGGVTMFTGDSQGVLEFNFAAGNASIDFSTASDATIVSTLETIMDTVGTLVTGNVASAGVTNTDMLLVFYESGTSGGSTSDAVIMRYQEGGTSEASFSGELSVVGILESVTDVDNVNIV